MPLDNYEIDIVPMPRAAPPATVQARDDETLLDLWLHGRPETTARAYRTDIDNLRRYLGSISIRHMSIGQLQAWCGTLADLSPATRRRKIAAAKSLLAFAHKVGFLPFDTGRPILMPPIKDTLAERILEEAEVQRMLGLEPNPRNHALLRLLYGCGLRISEVTGLAWRDLKGSKKGGQATVFGKGGKTRVVLISAKLWRMLLALRVGADPDAAVFRSRMGGRLDDSQVHRVVKAAAARAGLSAQVSAHWLRHAHASHALDHGAPIHVVQQSLGHGSLSTTTRYVHARPGDGSSAYLPE